MNTTHTKGPWRVNRDQIEYSEEGMYLSGLVIESPSEDFAIASLIEWQSPLEAEANATLIAEAGTVAHETGKTPRQLAEEHREMLEALKEAIRVYGDLRPQDGATLRTLETYQLMLCTIAKAEGRA